MFYRVVILDMESGVEVARLEQKDSVFTKATFLADRRTVLAFDSGKGVISRWDMPKGEKLSELALPNWSTKNPDGTTTINFNEGETPVDIAADGRFVVYVAQDKPAELQVIPLN